MNKSSRVGPINAIDGNHYPTLFLYAYNEKTKTYVPGLRMKDMMQVTKVSKSSLYLSASFGGKPMKNGWMFSYTEREDWKQSYIATTTTVNSTKVPLFQTAIKLVRSIKL